MTVLTQRRPADPFDFLQTTQFVDFQHKIVQQVIASLELNNLPQPAQAIRIFEFVRDDIRFEFAPKQRKDEFQASYTLDVGRGYCGQKAVVLAALGRAVGIPTALVFAELEDLSLNEKATEIVGSNILPWHGLGAFFIDSDWKLVDPTFSPNVVRRNSYKQVEFDGRKDALLSPETLHGKPHARYVEWHGFFADLPFDEIQTSMAERVNFGALMS